MIIFWTICEQFLKQDQPFWTTSLSTRSSWTDGPGRTLHAAERFPQLAAQDGIRELKNELSYVSGWLSVGGRVFQLSSGFNQPLLVDDCREIVLVYLLAIFSGWAQSIPYQLRSFFNDNTEQTKNFSHGLFWPRMVHMTEPKKNMLRI